MTDIDTKELRRLMEEATPGPWTTCHNGHYWEIGTDADAWFGQQIGDLIASEHMYRSPRDGDFEDHSEANAALIVAMHAALPALLSEAEEAKSLREELAALRAAPAAEPVAQCCMCGKTGLSTVEGDGGSECQLSDGRWTCSFECWERATERDAPPAPVADGWRPDAEKMREDCARWCETNGFSEAAPMLRKLPISRSRAAPTEAGR